MCHLDAGFCQSRAVISGRFHLLFRYPGCGFPASTPTGLPISDYSPGLAGDTPSRTEPLVLQPHFLHNSVTLENKSSENTTDTIFSDNDRKAYNYYTPLNGLWSLNQGAKQIVASPSY
jgi:hypothetical protein